MAEAEKRFEREGKRFDVITQNVDGFDLFFHLKIKILFFFEGLHRKAGTRNLIEMHGIRFMR